MNNINVNGPLIADTDAWLYDWFEEAYTAPADIKSALAEADTAEDITLTICSPGGLCSAGAEMVNDLRDWANANGRKVNVVLGSTVASMASVMAFSFTGTIEAHQNTMVMLHTARVGGMSGNATQLQAEAKALEIINGNMVTTLAQRTGKKPEDVSAWFVDGKDLWMGVTELQTEGLITGVIDEPADLLPATVTAPNGEPMQAAAFLSKVCGRAALADSGTLAAVAALSDLPEALRAESKPTALAAALAKADGLAEKLTAAEAAAAAAAEKQTAAEAARAEAEKAAAEAAEKQTAAEKSAEAAKAELETIRAEYRQHMAGLLTPSPATPTLSDLPKAELVSRWSAAVASAGFSAAKRSNPELFAAVAALRK